MGPENGSSERGMTKTHSHMRVNYVNTPTLGGLMKKRNGDKEKQKAGEKSKKSK